MPTRRSSSSESIQEKIVFCIFKSQQPPRCGPSLNESSHDAKGELMAEGEAANGLESTVAYARSKRIYFKWKTAVECSKQIGYPNFVDGHEHIPTYISRDSKQM